METNEQLKSLEGAKTFVKDLSEECRKNLMKVMHEREAMENLPELEDTNFRIKNTKNRKEIRDLNGVRVKVNPEGDVREYMEGYYKGEQLFTKKSALRETKKAGKKMPKIEMYRNICNIRYEGNYQKFLKGEYITFPGYYSSKTKRFYCIGEEFNLRCSDEATGYGNTFSWKGDHISNDNYGYSIRCLKSAK